MAVIEGVETQTIKPQDPPGGGYQKSGFGDRVKSYEVAGEKALVFEKGLTRVRWVGGFT